MKHFLSAIVFGTLISLSVPSIAEDAPLRLELSVPHTTHLGGKATLKIQIVNLTTREVKFSSPPGGTGAEEDYTLTLSHEDGRPVDRTAYGRALANEIQGPDDPANNYSMSGSSMIVGLMPEHTFVQTVELSDVFQITEPGRYIVQVEREFPTEPAAGIIKSDSLTMTVH